MMCLPAQRLLLGQNPAPLSTSGPPVTDASWHACCKLSTPSSECFKHCSVLACRLCRRLMWPVDSAWESTPPWRLQAPSGICALLAAAQKLETSRLHMDALLAPCSASLASLQNGFFKQSQAPYMQNKGPSFPPAMQQHQHLQPQQSMAGAAYAQSSMPGVSWHNATQSTAG